MRHTMMAAALLAALTLVAGCGSEDSTSGTPSPSEITGSASETPSESPSAEASESPSEEPEATSEEPEAAGTVIEVTLADGKVTPAGDRVEAVAGEPITFRIDADVAGELHVHSAAGDEIAFQAGTSEHQVVIDQPGVVEVELHDPPLIVVQLEVR